MKAQTTKTLLCAALMGLAMLTCANRALSQTADSAAKPAEKATVKIMTSFYPDVYRHAERGERRAGC